MVRKNMSIPMSKNDLQLKFQALTEIIDIFENLDIDYFIGGNVLLGIMRTGDFMPRRMGTAIALKHEDYENNKKNIFNALMENGFDTRKNSNKSGLKEKIKADKFDNFFELVPWYKSGSNRIRKKYILPEKFFTPGNLETLRGRQFQTMNPPIKYLEFRFGDTWIIDIDSLNRKKIENPRYWRKR